MMISLTALSFVEFVSYVVGMKSLNCSDEGIDIDSWTLNIFVDAYCKEGRMEDAESLAKLMLQRKIGPDIFTYTWLIEGYCLQGNMSKSREVFDLMRSRREFPDVAIYNSLINGYCKASKIEEAMHLFDEMMKSVVERNAYNSQRIDIEALFADGCGTRTPSILAELFKVYEVPIPNECTCKIVLEGLCNNNQVEEAVSLFHSVGECDNKLNSNIALYNILIDGAFKSGKLGIARTVYNDMTVKGLLPNAVTYAAMINGFCKEGLAGEAKEFFLEMKNKGLLQNNGTCMIILLGFLKNRQFDIVEMLLLEMEGRGFGFDESTVKHMFSNDAPFLKEEVVLFSA